MDPASNQHANELGFDLASVSSRLGARVVDAAIGFGVWIALFLILVAANDVDLTDVDNETGLSGTADLLLRVALFLVWGSYEVFLTARGGQTAGKMVTRIKVVTVSGGEAPDLGPAAIRWAVLALPMALLPDVLGLGGSLLVGLWFIWDSHRQGLHDKSASTYVVKNPSKPPAV